MFISTLNTINTYVIFNKDNIYYKRQMEELIGEETTTLFGSEFPEIYL